MFQIKKLKGQSSNSGRAPASRPWISSPEQQRQDRRYPSSLSSNPGSTSWCWPCVLHRIPKFHSAQGLPLSWTLWSRQMHSGGAPAGSPLPSRPSAQLVLSVLFVFFLPCPYILSFVFSRISQNWDLMCGVQLRFSCFVNACKVPMSSYIPVATCTQCCSSWSFAWEPEEPWILKAFSSWPS